jgi:hypothetical protein
MVPSGRLELPRIYIQQILSLPRLPIPPQGHTNGYIPNQSEKIGDLPSSDIVSSEGYPEGEPTPGIAPSSKIHPNLESKNRLLQIG